MQDDLLCTVPHTCRKPVRLQIFSSPCVKTICLLDAPSPSGSPTTPPRVKKICMHDSPPPALVQFIVTSNISSPSLPCNLRTLLRCRKCTCSWVSDMWANCLLGPHVTYPTAG